MEELNGVQVRVLSVNIKHNTFELDVDSRAFRPYASGGLVTQVKQPKTLSFRPLADALRRPGEFLLLDFAKFDRSPQLHVGFAALDRFRASHGRLPAPWDDADAAELVRLAGEVNDTMGDAKVDRVDEDVLQKLAFTASGYLNPLAAMFGGVVGQEVIKACSGKFHPITQWLYFDCVEALVRGTEISRRGMCIACRRWLRQARLPGSEGCWAGILACRELCHSLCFVRRTWLQVL